jgi:hypothetical protein
VPAGAQSTSPPSRFTVSPAPVTTAPDVTVSWARPEGAIAEDEWRLCPVVAGSPCRTGATSDATVAFPNLAEGRYVFRVRGRLNTTPEGEFWDDSTEVTTDRTAPTAPTVDWRMATEATGALRPALAATGEQAAPIARVRWTRCMDVPLPGQPACVEGSSAPDDVAIPVDAPRPAAWCGWASGGWQISVWLVDAAGNENRANATQAFKSMPIPGCPVTPQDPRLRVTGTLKPSGKRPKATVSVNVAPGATGQVALRVTPKRGRTVWKARRATRTVRGGRATWTVRVPARATRASVEARYAGGGAFTAATKRTGIRLAR